MRPQAVVVQPGGRQNLDTAHTDPPLPPSPDVRPVPHLGKLLQHETQTWFSTGIKLYYGCSCFFAYIKVSQLKQMKRDTLETSEMSKNIFIEY